MKKETNKFKIVLLGTNLILLLIIMARSGSQPEAFGALLGTLLIFNLFAYLLKKYVTNKPKGAFSKVVIFILSFLVSLAFTSIVGLQSPSEFILTVAVTILGIRQASKGIEKNV